MSDHPQEAGWWRATDGRWYPPHLHPRYAELRDEVATAHPLDAPQPGPPEVTDQRAAGPLFPPGPPGPPGPGPTDPVRVSGDHPGSTAPDGPVAPPTVRTIGSNSMGWTWFSPPAAIALFASCAVLLFSLAAPGSIVSFFLIGLAAVWTVRAVVRVRGGYGAEVMSLVAVVVAVLALVVACVALARSFTEPDPMPGTSETPPLPVDEVPDPDQEIAWYELRAPWCFDIVDPGEQDEWIRTVTVRACTSPHDAQAVAVERGERVQQRALDALLGATFGDPGSTTTTVSGAAAPTSAAPTSAAPTSAAPTSTVPEDVDPVEEAMYGLCRERSATVLVDPLPEGLVVVPIYPAAMQTVAEPALVCVLVDTGGGVLTRDFVD
jgi:hypothetical protein